LLKIYRLISEIDWKDDGIILFWSGDEYQPVYPTLFSERQMNYEVTEIFTYFMEMQAAFALQLKYFVTWWNRATDYSTVSMMKQVT
jgi:hypothetical protein